MCETTTSKRPNRAEKSQGMNWISQHKRLAIYLRDGLACCYCGAKVTEGTKLTLDHVVPYSEGGVLVDQKNLVTACHTCNSRRQNKPVSEYVQIIAKELGLKKACILRHIDKCLNRELDTKFAKQLVENQGSCFKAIQSHFIK
jgi:5-methylcytosine-specific restriction endonuclease McrA